VTKHGDQELFFFVDNNDNSCKSVTLDKYDQTGLMDSAEKESDNNLIKTSEVI
jgi:hypothetical protein